MSNVLNLLTLEMHRWRAVARLPRIGLLASRSHKETTSAWPFVCWLVGWLVGWLVRLRGIKVVLKMMLERCGLV
jgi:hypothetical protein